MKKLTVLLFVTSFVMFSCKKKTNEPEPQPAPTPTPVKEYPDSVWNQSGTGPFLIFKFKFDSTQTRLDNLGQPAPNLPSGRAAYSPKFNKMAAHYIELAQTSLTALGAGKVLYHATETTKGGATAIDFVHSIVVREGVVFFSIPLSQIAPGTYEWLRLSLSYQNYDIPYKANALPGNHIGNGTIASFVGYSTYMPKYKIKDKDFVPSASTGGPNANHLQGYWGFETNIPGYGYYTADGQAPAGATTVVNPNFANSPIPAGSCVVTARFTNMSGTDQLLTITGAETQNITVTASLSTNKSFEWTEVNADGYYQPEIGEVPVDMGVRGLIPKVQY
jgi:hypothetical protein